MTRFVTAKAENASEFVVYPIIDEIKEAVVLKPKSYQALYAENATAESCKKGLILLNIPLYVKFLSFFFNKPSGFLTRGSFLRGSSFGTN